MYDLHSCSLNGDKLLIVWKYLEYRNINTNILFIINFDQPKKEMINKQDFSEMIQITIISVWLDNHKAADIFIRSIYLRQCS